MVAKRHHFISQCYLRGFTEDPQQPRLFVTDFKERRTFCTSPVNVALEKHFHTVDVPGQAPDVVEKRISEFESDLGPALRRIVAAASLADVEDRSHLFFFMALLFIKNPQRRKTVGSFMGESAEMMMQMKAADAVGWEADMARAKAEGTLEQDADTDAMRKHVLEGAFTYGVSTPGHLLLEFNLVEKLLPYFHGRKWRLYKSDANRTTFITTDNPVCLMWGDREMMEPPGLGRLGTQIVFSVSNEVAIVGTFEGEETTIRADPALVSIINGNILPFATRQVYARGDDFAYAMPHIARTMQGTELLNDAVSRWEDEETS